MNGGGEGRFVDPGQMDDAAFNSNPGEKTVWLQLPRKEIGRVRTQVISTKPR